MQNLTREYNKNTKSFAQASTSHEQYVTFFSEMFKDDVELCKTSAEFLLNPWVLMQLPWQPVLLLQWTAGVLIEMYALRLELVELYRWPLPFKVNLVVKKFFKLLVNFPSHALRSLNFLHQYFGDSSGNRCYKNACAFLNQMTHDFLPLLEFVVSGKARDVVRGLKRMSLGRNFEWARRGKNYYTIYTYINWESQSQCVFSDKFWCIGDLKKVIGCCSKGPNEWELMCGMKATTHLCGSDIFEKEATSEWTTEMETKYGKKIQAKTVCTAEIDFKLKKILTTFQV